MTAVYVQRGSHRRRLGYTFRPLGPDDCRHWGLGAEDIRGIREIWLGTNRKERVIMITLRMPRGRPFARRRRIT